MGCGGEAGRRAGGGAKLVGGEAAWRAAQGVERMQGNLSPACSLAAAHPRLLSTPSPATHTSPHSSIRSGAGACWRRWTSTPLTLQTANPMCFSRARTPTVSCTSLAWCSRASLCSTAATERSTLPALCRWAGGWRADGDGWRLHPALLNLLNLPLPASPPPPADTHPRAHTHTHAHHMQAIVLGLIVGSLFAPIDHSVAGGRQVMALASLSAQVGEGGGRGWMGGVRLACAVPASGVPPPPNTTPPHPHPTFDLQAMAQMSMPQIGLVFANKRVGLWGRLGCLSAGAAGGGAMGAWVPHLPLPAPCLPQLICNRCSTSKGTTISSRLLHTWSASC